MAHVGRGRGFHRLNEIVTYRLGQGVFANSGSETINTSASRPQPSAYLLWRQPTSSVISLREPISEGRDSVRGGNAMPFSVNQGAEYIIGLRVKGNRWCSSMGSPTAWRLGTTWDT